VENNCAASVGDGTGGVGSDPDHLHGNTSNISSAGYGDTTPNIDFIFVDPLNMLLAGFTSDISLEITDCQFTVLTLLMLMAPMQPTVQTLNALRFQALKKLPNQCFRRK
jgi:hypothetical protein